MAAGVNSKGEEKSLAHLSDEFLRRILARKSDVGRSSFYYRNNDAQVPFAWEQRPGLPKHLSEDGCSLPQVAPPPASAFQLMTQTGDGSTPNMSCFWRRSSDGGSKNKGIFKGMFIK